MTLKRTGKPEHAALEQNVDDALRKIVAQNLYSEAQMLKQPKQVTGLPKGGTTIQLVAGADNYFDNPLGRAPRGFHVANVNDAASIYTSPTKNTAPDKKIILRTSADVNATILVF